jgi:dolichol-phosphate mannosyltransferase
MSNAGGLAIEHIKTKNADIVYSIKQSINKRFTSRLTSALYHYVFSRIVRTNVPLNIGTFRAFNRKFLAALLQFGEVNVLYGPLMFYMGFNSSFIEVKHQLRANGKSSYTFLKRLQLAVNSLISYTDIPHTLSMIFGGLLLFGSIFYGLLVLIQYFLFGSLLPGGSTLILFFLSITLGSIMISLGVIGSYIFRVYQEVLKRPRYLIQNKINFSNSKKS